MISLIPSLVISAIFIGVFVAAKLGDIIEGIDRFFSDLSDEIFGPPNL